MTGPVLLCFDGSDEAVGAIRRAAELLVGREGIVLSVVVPAKDELPLDPMSDLVGRLSGLYGDWDEMCAELAERQARSGSALELRERSSACSAASRQEWFTARNVPSL